MKASPEGINLLTIILLIIATWVASGAVFSYLSQDCPTHVEVTVSDEEQ